MKNIKAVALDVDGVLTDGTVYWGANGEELKRFCFADISGIPLARKAGIVLGLISGETSPSGMKIVERFAAKLGIEDVYKGCTNKIQAVETFAAKYKLELTQVCFMGDDIIDLPALRRVGFSVAPSNAHVSVREQVNIVTHQTGGCGAVRELLDMLIATQEKQGSSKDKVDE